MRSGRSGSEYQPCSSAIGCPSASRTRSIHQASWPGPSPRALATSAGGRSRSTPNDRVEGVRPRRRMSWLNDARCSLLSSRGRATNVPFPWMRCRSPSTIRLSIDLRTVSRETLYVDISSRSDGIAAPGPSSRAASSSSTARSCTCLGSGPSVIRVWATRRPRNLPSRFVGMTGTVWYVPVENVGSPRGCQEHRKDPPDADSTTRRDPHAHGAGDRRAARRRTPHARGPAPPAPRAGRALRRATPGAVRRSWVQRQRGDLRPLPARDPRPGVRRAALPQRRDALLQPAGPLRRPGGLGQPVRRDRGDRRDAGVGPRLRGGHCRGGERRGLLARERRRPGHGHRGRARSSPYRPPSPT